MSRTALETFVHDLLEERGLDFRGYKPASLERRIRKRYLQLGIEDLTRYMDLLKADPEEVETLLNSVLINVTEFFRDPQAWDLLRAEVLSPLFGLMRPGDIFRAWSAGCSNGEEPYSLAIAIAELLGSSLPEFDIKIYGTDIDEHSLALARRGEYTVDQLRRVPARLRDKHFTALDNGIFRIGRDLRRMVIFGKSNILSDAPISHCQLVLCRNVLIYLDADAQRRVFHKLHYALDPGGFLFLGKAESRLSESSLFQPLHPRWRVFQKLGGRHNFRKDLQTMDPTEDALVHRPSADRTQQELEEIRLRQRYLLETLKSGVLVMDANDTVTTGNEAILAIWGVPLARLLGRRIHATELAQLCPQIGASLDKGSTETQAFQCRAHVHGEDRLIAVTLRPVLADDETRSGTLLYAEDITYHKRLQQAVQQLEATSEELQSANEELETTNEELQSTNEELETTNEELQSTNEELETTNEELQSVNEELENMNEELESRTSELNSLASRYAQTLHRMPWPVIVVDKEEQVQIWNTAAQRMLGFSDESAVGIKLEQLPLQPAAMRSMLRRARMAVLNGKAYVLHGQSISAAAQPTLYDIHFTPVMQSGTRVEEVLILFGPVRPVTGKRKSLVIAGESNGE